jgi:putative aldouronate transport system permease protein
LEKSVKIGRGKRVTREGFKLWLMISPFIVITVIFAYYPLYGWIYAFYDWKPPFSLSQTPFVGFHMFTTLVSNPIRLNIIMQVLRNTFAISGLSILTSVLPVIFAIFLSEIKIGKYKKGVQILTTLPNFISWVMVYSMAFALFANSGMFNSLLMSMNVISRPIPFLTNDNHTWLTMTAWSTWKGLGYGAILYLASMSGIDSELYEAARVDGAGRFRLMWHITVPGLIPTYMLLLLLHVANFLNSGFDQYYVFSNAFNMAHIEVLDLYVYNIGLAQGSYSLGTAVNMMKSVVSIVLFLSMNTLSKVLRGNSIV